MQLDRPRLGPIVIIMIFLLSRSVINLCRSSETVSLMISETVSLMTRDGLCSPSRSTPRHQSGGWSPSPPWLSLVSSRSLPVYGGSLVLVVVTLLGELGRRRVGLSLFLSSRSYPTSPRTSPDGEGTFTSSYCLSSVGERWLPRE